MRCVLRSSSRFLLEIVCHQTWAACLRIENLFRLLSEKSVYAIGTGQWLVYGFKKTTVDNIHSMFSVT